jgi:hypothetical protein
MRTCWYIVIESMGQWWVDCEGDAYGPFDNDEIARIEACRIAMSSSDEDGRRAEVWAVEPDGSHRRIWRAQQPS